MCFFVACSLLPAGGLVAGAYRLKQKLVLIDQSSLVFQSFLRAVFRLR
jgi:hypothetical protein